MSITASPHAPASQWERTRRHWERKYRNLTSRLRILPDFIIIGAQKSGTTSLYGYLAQHPQLLPSFEKEVHYFDGGLSPRTDTYALGERWYRAHFALPTSRWRGRRSFEASPLYLFNPLAPERIARHLPQARLIAILRDPVERAISHYFHEARREREPLPMLAAFQAEESRLRPVLAAGEYKSDAFIHHSYLSRGRYHEQLQRYFEHFRRDQLLVLKSETLFTDPVATLRRVFNFVGVDSAYAIPDLAPRHVATNRAKVGDEIHDYLQASFRTHNQQLYRLIGEDFGW